MNNVLYFYGIKISVNHHLNSSLRKEEEHPLVHTGILRTATIMTVHTQVPVYWHNTFKKYCCNLHHIHLYSLIWMRFKIW
jgi:hypothetical protein